MVYPFDAGVMGIIEKFRISSFEIQKSKDKSESTPHPNQRKVRRGTQEKIPSELDPYRGGFIAAEEDDFGVEECARDSSSDRDEITLALENFDELGIREFGEVHGAAIANIARYLVSHRDCGDFRHEASRMNEGFEASIAHLFELVKGVCV
jgi:hypothetical protein